MCDGGAGCIAAAREEWSGIRVQRYLVHVLCNAGRDLTNRPNTDTGRELLALATGCIAAAREEWSGIRVQRYLVHVLCNAGRDLTNRPNTDTGRELLALARALTGVDDGEKASEWLSVIGGILALTVTDRRARDLSGNAISVPCSSRVYARNGERDRRH